MKEASGNMSPDEKDDTDARFTRREFLVSLGLGLGAARPHGAISPETYQDEPVEREITQLDVARALHTAATKRSRLTRNKPLQFIQILIALEQILPQSHPDEQIRRELYDLVGLGAATAHLDPNKRSITYEVTPQNAEVLAGIISPPVPEHS